MMKMNEIKMKKSEGTWIFSHSERAVGADETYVVQRRVEDGLTRRIYTSRSGRETVRYSSPKVARSIPGLE